MLKPILSAAWRRVPRSIRRTVVRAIEPTFTVATGVVVTDSQGRVLLLEHVFRPGTGWGIPGGFLRRREQPERAIRRELREEIDVGLDNLQLAFVRTLVSTNQVEIVFTATTPDEPKPRGVEIASYAWIHPDRLVDVLPADQRQLVVRALTPAARHSA